jgi:hypothetical protein
MNPLKHGDTINPHGSALLPLLINLGEGIEYPDVPIELRANHSACVGMAIPSLIEAIANFKKTILGRRYLANHLFGDVQLGDKIVAEMIAQGLVIKKLENSGYVDNNHIYITEPQIAWTEQELNLGDHIIAFYFKKIVPYEYSNFAAFGIHFISGAIDRLFGKQKEGVWVGNNDDKVMKCSELSARWKNTMRPGYVNNVNEYTPMDDLLNINCQITKYSPMQLNWTKFSKY